MCPNLFFNKIAFYFTGFHGKRCELEYNECLSNPCANQGTCIDRVDKFECRCTIGYKGKTCQEKVRKYVLKYLWKIIFNKVTFD